MSISGRLSKYLGYMKPPRRRRRSALDKDILFCGYHKVGTVLFSNALDEITDEYSNVSVSKHWNIHDVDAVKTGDFSGIHVIRDPRDVVASGYLYHRRTKELWCVNTEWDTSIPIFFPQIPATQAWRSEEWKRNYISELGGRSYQQILNESSQEDGINFEMEHYGRWTIEEMVQWNFDDRRFVEVRFEDIMADFDGSFRRILSHCKFAEDGISLLLKRLARYDLSRMSDRAIRSNRHIHGRNTSKWRGYFTDANITAFKDRFGDALIALGYEQDNDW